MTQAAQVGAAASGEGHVMAPAADPVGSQVLQDEHPEAPEDAGASSPALVQPPTETTESDGRAEEDSEAYATQDLTPSNGGEPSPAAVMDEEGMGTMQMASHSGEADSANHDAPFTQEDGVHCPPPSTLGAGGAMAAGGPTGDENGHSDLIEWLKEPNPGSTTRKCPFQLCGGTNRAMLPRDFYTHVAREHQSVPEAATLLSSASARFAECSHCHRYYTKSGLTNHSIQCVAKRQRTVADLTAAGGQDLLDMMRGGWPEECAKHMCVSDLLQAARHPLLQRHRYPRHLQDTKLFCAAAMQLYWKACQHESSSGDVSEACWALLMALPSILLSTSNLNESTTALRDTFRLRMHMLCKGKIHTLMEQMWQSVANNEGHRRSTRMSGETGGGDGEDSDDSEQAEYDEAWAAQVTNKLHRGQIAKAFQMEKRKAVLSTQGVEEIQRQLMPADLTPYQATTTAGGAEHKVRLHEEPLRMAIANTRGVTDAFGWSGELLNAACSVKEPYALALDIPSDHSNPEKTFTGLLAKVANNDIPESIRQAVCAINYTVLESAGGKLRPVGTDSIFNKVINRTLLEMERSAINNLLERSPELAVGVKDGTMGAAGMALGQYQAHRLDEDWTMMALDFKGAFNHTDRSKLHEIVRAKAPAFLRAFERLYARPTTHFIVDGQDNVVEVVVGQGVVQGNELSPFFFALYSCEVLDMLPAVSATAQGAVQQGYRCKIIKYLDDVVLMGQAEHVIEDAKLVQERGKAVGLELQPKKSRYYTPTERLSGVLFESSFHGAQPLEGGMVVLGVPIGTAEYCKSHLLQRAEEVKTGLERMRTHGVARQALLTALQYVSSMVNHFYVLPPSLTNGMSEMLNHACIETFVKAFFDGIDLEEKFESNDEITKGEYLRLRLFLRARDGGMGLHDLAARGSIAFVCNMAKLSVRFSDVHQKLAQSQELSQAIKECTEANGLTDKALGELAQTKPAQIIAERKVNELAGALARCGEQARRAYRSACETGASTILTMRGRDSLRRLDDLSFQIAVCGNMGFGLLELLNLVKGAPCELCARKVPQPGVCQTHILSCRPHARHDALRDAAKEMIEYATQARVTTERYDGARDKRLDLHCRNFLGTGMYGAQKSFLGLDVTVVSAQPAEGARVWAVGKAMKEATKQKMSKYKGFNNDKTHVVALAMTATGGLGSDFLSLLRRLAVVAEDSGVYQPGLEENFATRWKERLTATLHIANKDMLVHHFGQGLWV